MARKKYTQEQQVIDVLRQIGGYATLGDLYRLVDTKSWATKTPNESIRKSCSNLRRSSKSNRAFGPWRIVARK